MQPGLMKFYTLSAPTSSTLHAPPHRIDACRDIEENPLGLNSLQSNLPPPSPIMAFQHADLTPFLPSGMQWEEVPNMMFVVRAVALSRPQPRNENVDIATISPVPDIALNFAVVKEMLRKFLVDQERVTILDI